MEQGRKHSPAGRSTPVTAQDIREGRSADDSSFTHLRDSVTEAMRILVLRRWAFFVPFCLIACVAAVGSHRIPRTYQSTTTIERRDHPVLMNLRQSTGGFAKFFRPSLSRDVTSPDVMNEVVENLGYCDNLPRDEEGNLTPESETQRSAIAANLGAGIMARITEKSNHLDQIVITHVGSKPTISQQLVKEVKDVYIKTVRRKLTETLLDVQNYFQEEVQRQRDKSATIEEGMLRFKAEHPGVDPTEPSALTLKITSFESEQSVLKRDAADLEQEIQSRRHLLDRYKQQAARPVHANRETTIQVPNMAKSPYTQELETEIRRLQAQIHDLQLTRRMTDMHPDIVERRNRITLLRKQLQDQYVTDASTIPANQGVDISDESAQAAVEAAFGFQAELANLQLEIEDRLAKYDRVKERLAIIETDLKEHRALMASVFDHRKDYKKQQDLLDQANVGYQNNMSLIAEIQRVLDADESERGMSFVEITPPTGSSRPIKPKAKTVLILSLLAGLAAGVIGVLFKELFDQTYHTTKQVSHSLGLNILESIDQIVTSADRAKLFRRRVLLVPAVVTVLLGCVGTTFTLAYLSIERPTTFERLMTVPGTLWDKMENLQGTATASVANADSKQEEKAG